MAKTAVIYVKFVPDAMCQKIIKIGQCLTKLFKKLEIRFVERGICPIATLYSLAAAFQHLTLL